MELIIKCDRCHKEMNDRYSDNILVMKASHMTVKTLADLDIKLDEKMNYSMHKWKIILCDKCTQKLESFMLER